MYRSNQKSIMNHSVVFHRSLDDSNFPRTLLSILDNLNNAVVYTVLIPDLWSSVSPVTFSVLLTLLQGQQLQLISLSPYSTAF